ncbi:MAG: sugar transferase [Phycisphaerales bacterium]|nr:MAG: sugar transferase [Phycisphaerales bacterium]
MIHVDTRLAAAVGLGREQGQRVHCLGSTDLLDWYCQWAARQAHSVFVLLPERLKTGFGEIGADPGQISPLWYGDHGAVSLPPMHRRGQLWIVNGNQLPVVDQETVRSAVRRNHCDVVVFASSAVAEAAHYPESVLVGETGEVVTVKRHYNDSPSFTDLWTGEACFLVASNGHASAVLNHVIARGWGLDSIGALTRRFNVRWSSSSCVVGDFRSPRSMPASYFRRSGTGDRSAATVGSDDSSRVVDARSRPLNWAGVEQQARGTATRSNGVGVAGPSFDADKGDDGKSVSLADSPKGPAGNRAYLFVKRVIDLIGAAVGLMVLSPLLLAVAVLVKCTSRGPVLFVHRRQGLGGEEFGCLKLRTMRVGADAEQALLQARNEVDGPQFKIANDPRLTRLGIWLRRRNVDELPQLVNVLLGQMSLVGPRPSPDEENQLCPEWRRTRLSVKPGITGLWQVLRLRDEQHSDFQEWIYYDEEYARHRSIWLDLQILVYTPLTMFASRRLIGLAKRLERHGICAHSARLGQHQTPISCR